MRYVTLIFSLLALISCGKQNPNTLIVGTISGPETELVDVAQKVAHDQYGLTVKIVEFSDYNLPNAALQDGSLDVNVYQHLPYLEESKAAHGYDLEVIGKTFIYPAGLYSHKYKRIAAIPENAWIAIPNDPSNEARALLLLKKAGLIKLKNKRLVGVQDITSNPRSLHFKPLDAAQLPRILDDVDAAVINTSFAIPAGLHPSRDALFIEGKDSPYANLIVIRRNSTNKEQLSLFVKALNSEEVKQKAQALFGNDAIAAW